jgi:uncharacterized membrane protein YfcA
VGALISAFGIGGPLLVLYLLNRKWPARVVRASLAFYFLIIMSAGVVGYGVTGLYTTQRLALILMVLLPVLAGIKVSQLLTGKMKESSFRRGAIAVIILASIMVLAREVLRI